MTVSEYLLKLTQEALALAEDPSPSVSAVARRAYRIARRRGDLEAVYWLSYEMYPTGSKLAHGAIQREVLRHLSRDQAKALHERTLNRYLESRALTTLDKEGFPESEPKVSGASLAEMEIHLENMLRDAEEVAYDQATLEYDSAVDVERRLKRTLRWSATENRKVLSRILTRIHQFLVSTEAALVAGQGHAAIVQRNHEFVEGELRQLSPEALSQLQNASQAVLRNDPESWSMAGTSCRRALKSVADVISPPRREPLEAADGRTHDLSDAKWVNRLWQFISERVSGDGALSTLRADLDFLGGRVDSLNVVSSKGVHANLSQAESEICVTRTYLLIGDLLRLNDDESGLEAVQTERPDKEISERLLDETPGAE